MLRPLIRHRLVAVAAILTLTLVTLGDVSTATARTPHLTRHPYLTDVVSAGSTYNATINWATDQSQATAFATFGQAGVEASTAHKTNGSKTAMSVNGVPEYQWQAKNQVGSGIRRGYHGATESAGLPCGRIPLSRAAARCPTPRA